MNDEPKTEADYSPSVNSAQVTIAFLALAVVILALVVIIARGGFVLPSSGMTFGVIGILAAGLALVGRLFLQNVTEQSAATEPEEQEDDLPTDKGELETLYNKQLVATAMMLTAGGLINIFAFYREQNWWSLTIAFLMVVAMVAGFPNQERLDRWVKTRQQRSSE